MVGSSITAGTAVGNAVDALLAHLELVKLKPHGQPLGKNAEPLLEVQAEYPNEPTGPSAALPTVPVVIEDPSIQPVPMLLHQSALPPPMALWTLLYTSQHSKS